MVCHKCGQELTGKENFCSFCGEKVDFKNSEKGFVKESKEEFSFVDPVEKKPFIKPEIPEMNWNVKEFIPVANKKEDPIIFWRTEDMFMGKELMESKNKNDFAVTDSKSEIHDNKDIGEKIDRENKTDFEVPDIFTKKKEEESKPSFLIDSGLFDDEEYLNIKDAEENYYQDAKELLENSDSDLRENIDDNIFGEENDFVNSEDKDSVFVEQPSGSIEIELVGDDKKEVTVNYEPEMTRVILDDEELKNLENIIKEAKMKEEGSEENSPTLFEEIAEGVVDTLEHSKIDEEKKRIDKFYTFNRKKEEFQQLLDKEYERIEKNVESGGFEKDVESFIDVEIGKEVEGTSQLEEMVKARELFFDNNKPVEVQEVIEEDGDDVSQKEIDDYTLEEEKEVVDSENEALDSKVLDSNEKDSNIDLEEDKKIEIAKNLDSDNNLALDSVDEELKTETSESEKQNNFNENHKPDFLEDKKNKFIQVPYEKDKELTEDTAEDKEIAPEGMKLDISENGDPSRVIIEPKNTNQLNDEEKEKIEKEFFESSEEKRRGRGIKILVSILIFLIIVIGGLFVIRVAMPTSYIAQYIDEVSNKVFSVFKSDREKDKIEKNNEVKKEDVKENNQEAEEENVVEKKVTTETNEEN